MPLLPVSRTAQTLTNLMERAIAYIVDESMYFKSLPASPGPAHNGRATDIRHLFDHAQFTQAARTFLITRKPTKQQAMVQSDVLHMKQPVIG